LQGFHQEISPRNFGQNFPVGFQDVGSKFSRRFSGRNILKKLFYLLGGHYTYLYLTCGGIKIHNTNHNTNREDSYKVRPRETDFSFA
jgi:hypothetical protein